MRCSAVLRSEPSTDACGVRRRRTSRSTKLLEVGRVCDGMVESPQSAVCNSVALLLIFQL